MVVNCRYHRLCNGGHTFRVGGNEWSVMLMNYKNSEPKDTGIPSLAQNEALKGTKDRYDNLTSDQYFSNRVLIHQSVLWNCDECDS